MSVPNLSIIEEQCLGEINIRSQLRMRLKKIQTVEYKMVAFQSKFYFAISYILHYTYWKADNTICKITPTDLVYN